jgi:APA family basic amino acid/polyamine antiporter
MQRGSLFLTRSIDALTRETQEAEGPRLRRALGPASLVAIGLGNMVGAGIFATIGDGVHNKAGAAVIVSFLIAGVACAFAALCYAEFSSMVPLAGSAYTYSYATLGEFVAWIIGWDLILEYGISAAPVASTLSQNLQNLLTATLGVHLPHWATSAYSPSAHTVFDVYAFVAVLVFALLLSLGIRESAGTNTLLVFIKMGILTVFILVGLQFVHPVNWRPFAPFGFHGIIQGAFTVFFAFIGFDAVTTAAEEARNPQRDIPWGVLGALALGALFYVSIAVVLTGMQPAPKVDPGAPLAVALQAVHRGGWAKLMDVGAIFGTISVILTSLLGQSRIFYVMARDGLLPKAVAVIHPRFRTPARMTMVMGFIIAILAGLVPLDALLSLVNIGTFGAFILVCFGVIVLRRTQPQRERRFRAPLVPLVPALGILLSLFLIFYGSTWLVWVRFAAWLIVGLAIYFFYGYRHSEARRALALASPPPAQPAG